MRREYGLYVRNLRVFHIPRLHVVLDALFLLCLCHFVSVVCLVVVVVVTRLEPLLLHTTSAAFIVLQPLFVNATGAICVVLKLLFLHTASAVYIFCVIVSRSSACLVFPV